MRTLLVIALLANAAPAAWRAGAAKVKITPSEPIFLAGYAGRTKPSEGVLQDIWIKAAAFQDGAGPVTVITTSDLVGLDTGTIEEVQRRVLARHGVPRERILFNYSHNHSCPVTGQVLHLYYNLSPEQSAAVARYTARLHDWYVEAISGAIGALAPAELSFEQGLAGFAVNRRRARPGGRRLPGPVDHDVPVMAVRSGDRLRAILFGYSCHATALSGNEINGDYPGYAQQELETAYPDAVALFVMGCGGDANPLPRVMNSTGGEAVGLASMYGKILAAAVRQVLGGKMKTVGGPLRVAYGVADLPFRKAPSRETLLARRKSLTGLPLRFNDYLLKILERDGKLEEKHPYPVHVWRFGEDLTFIGLTGETVADYCLRFKGEYGWDNTWVAGYNNELLSYIPSLRVLREGGYEGTDGMAEYGRPAPYAPAVEEVIAHKVAELAEELGLKPAAAAGRER